MRLSRVFDSSLRSVQDLCSVLDCKDSHCASQKQVHSVMLLTRMDQRSSLALDFQIARSNTCILLGLRTLRSSHRLARLFLSTFELRVAAMIWPPTLHLFLHYHLHIRRCCMSPQSCSLRTPLVNSWDIPAVTISLDFPAPARNFHTAQRMIHLMSSAFFRRRHVRNHYKRFSSTTCTHSLVLNPIVFWWRVSWRDWNLIDLPTVAQTVPLYVKRKYNRCINFKLPTSTVKLDFLAFLCVYGATTSMKSEHKANNGCRTGTMSTIAVLRM